LILQLFQAAGAIRRGNDRITFGLKDLFQSLEDPRIVINGQDGGLTAFHQHSPLVKNATPKPPLCQ
jgi:hypothetical protein